MKKSIIKFFDKIILLLLGSTAVLYSSCDYGMPVENFEINGVISDSAHTPIQNIRVVNNKRDTLYTNSKGEYSFEFWGPDYAHLKIEDIDGEENGGEFRSVEFNVKFTDADLVKKGKRNKTGDKFRKTKNITLYRTDEIPPIEYGPMAAPFKP